MTPKLLFYTYADTRYSIFAIPYAYFALRSNPGSCVEILLEDHAGFVARNARALERMEAEFAGRFLFRQSTLLASGLRATPNVIRFVEPPVLEAEYVYIGDIDLLVLDDVLAIHLAYIREYRLPFSNVLRLETKGSDQPRLTGLHFCRYDRMYPLPDITDLDLAALNDEHVLFSIMQRRGYEVPESFRHRPECGVHMSLSRDPGGRCSGPGLTRYEAKPKIGWGGKGYHAALDALLQEDGFRLIFPDFDYEFRLLFTVLESRLLQRERTLHRVSLSYMIDKRLVWSAPDTSRSALKAKRGDLIEARDLEAAEEVSAAACLLWPTDRDTIIGRAWIAFARGQDAVAVECLHHYVDVGGGAHAETFSRLCRSNRARIAAQPGGESVLARAAGLAA